VHWGGLSGSPYSEAISWGKFVPPAEGGKFAEVFDDATVAMPLIVGAVLERLRK
jgi:deoxyhypusine synthase